MLNPVMKVGCLSLGSLDPNLFQTENDFASFTSGVDDREKLAANLLSLLKGALTADKWEVVQHQPELFARGGLIYDQVMSNLGPLADGKHVKIDSLPRKVRIGTMPVMVVTILVVMVDDADDGDDDGGDDTGGHDYDTHDLYRYWYIGHLKSHYIFSFLDICLQ